MSDCEICIPNSYTLSLCLTSVAPKVPSKLDSHVDSVGRQGSACTVASLGALLFDRHSRPRFSTRVRAPRGGRRKASRKWHLVRQRRRRRRRHVSALDRLREVLPEVFEHFVLPALDPTVLALLVRAGRGWHAAVVSSNLPRAGSSRGLPLKVSAFCGSVELLA